MKRALAWLLCLAALIVGCAQRGPGEPSRLSTEIPAPVQAASDCPDRGPDPGSPQEEPAVGNSLFPKAIALNNDYITSVTDEILEAIVQPGMEDLQRLRAAYDWLIANTWFERPVGLDIWRYRGDPSQAPGYLENRALSPLLFGLGSCEDYAAAMAVLARRMGYPAEYVFGMTLSVKGEYVDHAWAAVCLDGIWYHLDPQLEDNIARNGQLQNRYFMRCDAVMRTDHLWGEELIARRGGLSEAQKEAVRAFAPPVCDGETPPDPPRMLEQGRRPDRFLIEEALRAERAAYHSRFGPLPEVRLETDPPVVIYDPF